MAELNKNIRKKYAALMTYTVIFYGIWTAWEIYFKPWLDTIIENEYAAQFIKSGVIKNLIWTFPAILIIKYFETDLYVGLREMFTAKVKWLKYLPIFLCFTVWLLAGVIIQSGKISVSGTFGYSSLIVVLFVGITEELVFRGWLLNGTLGVKRKWLPVTINALMFLAIHFPIWLYSGSFIDNFKNMSFLCVVVLSFIFSYAFLKSKNILVPVFLHMYWDLLMFLLY